MRKDVESVAIIAINLSPYYLEHVELASNNQIGTFTEYFSIAKKEVTGHLYTNLPAWSYQIWVKE
jgi:hypothetical protein